MSCHYCGRQFQGGQPAGPCASCGYPAEGTLNPGPRHTPEGQGLYSKLYVFIDGKLLTGTDKAAVFTRVHGHCTRVE